MRKSRFLLGGVCCFLLAAPAKVSAQNPVIEWNQVAVSHTLTAVPAQAPVVQGRTMAIVHVAVHDAVSGITGQYETYSRPGPAPAGATPEAAAIAAAHHALRAQFPGSAAALDATYASSLSILESTTGVRSQPAF